MWWTPKTEDELHLSNILPKMQEQFYSMLESERVLGVGSLFSPKGLLPLMLLHEDMLSGTLKRNLGAFPLTPMANMPQAIRNQLSNWQLPEDGMALFVSPPEPAAASGTIEAASGSVIRCQITRKRGTLGLPLVSIRPNWSRAFLTVGHLCPMGVGSVVELVDERLFGTDFRTLGKVVAHSNPVTPITSRAGYDFAVVELDPGVKVDAPKYSGFSVVRSPLTQPLRATLYGAISGVKPQAAIFGALDVYGGPHGIWKNAWMLLPSGLVSQGDSGGVLLLDSDQSVLGMVVGGSRFDESDSYLVQYAHDMDSLQREALTPAGYALA
jgi:hypothetical protein